MKILKKILKYFVPPIIVFCIKRLIQKTIDILVSINLFPLVDKNEIIKLKKLKKDYKKCFIIGSGPSVKNQDLSKIKNHFTIVHNAFYLVRNNYEMTPNLYVIEDYLPAADNSLELNKINDIKFVVPYQLKKYIHKKPNVTYINFDYSYIKDYKNDKDYFGKYLFSQDLSLKGFWGGTVVYLSLQIANYLEFKEVYLLGVDLSWTIPKSAKIEGAVITSTEDDPNHFHDNYFGKGKRWHLPRVERYKIGIENAIRELNQKGVKVYNCSPVSNIQGAKNLDFDKLMHEK
ncbi:MAG: 6-hydroxymethylpterin diphosphokinase MptE-like protein [Hydrogenophilales bacterium]